MLWSKKAINYLVVLVAVGMLASCAQYKMSAKRVNSYEGHIERLTIWSSIGGIRLLGGSFTDRFDAALIRNFQSEGVSAYVHEFTPKNLNKEMLGEFERELRPNARLFIQPTRYQTATIKGSTMISGLWLDLSLNDIATGRLVWRGSIFLDPGFDPSVWIDSGANKLALQIVNALKKDELLLPPSGATSE